MLKNANPSVFQKVQCILVQRPIGSQQSSDSDVVFRPAAPNDMVSRNSPFIPAPRKTGFLLSSRPTGQVISLPGSYLSRRPVFCHGSPFSRRALATLRS